MGKNANYLTVWACNILGIVIIGLFTLLIVVTLSAFLPKGKAISTFMYLGHTTVIFTLIAALLAFWCLLEAFYYNSTIFHQIKMDIGSYIENCNSLNTHIEELKNAYINISKDNFGQSKLIDNSKYNYQRRHLKKAKTGDNVYNCSLSVCKTPGINRSNTFANISIFNKQKIRYQILKMF